MPIPIVSTGRETVKPAAIAGVDKSGQYAALSGLWIFHELGGVSPNLANPGTGDATRQGAAAIASDAVGAALSTAGDASQYAATGLTGDALGIGGSASRTIFARVRPNSNNNNGGFFSYGTGAERRSMTVRQQAQSGTTWQLDMGWADIYASGVALAQVSTFVVTYDGTTVRLYHNGELEGGSTLALDTGTDALFQIARYKFGSNGAQNNFAFHGLVYEIGTIGGVAWSAGEVATYDANPLGMLTVEGGSAELEAVPPSIAAPAPDRPAITQVQALAASPPSVAAPAPGRPLLAQAQQLAAAGVLLGAVVLGAPAVSQAHASAAPSLSTGAPSLGTPAVAQVQELAGSTVSTGAPDLATPAPGQIHALVGQGPATGSPAIGVSALVQDHALGSSGVTAGAPSVASATLALAGQLSASALLTEAPAPGRAVLVQEHALAADELAAPAPELGTPGPDDQIYDPLGLGDKMLVSMDEARAHLRVDHTDEDADIALKLDAAEAEVLEYIQRPSPWLDADGVEVPAPAPIKMAVLMVLGDLFANREEGIVGATHTLNPTARRLLARYRQYL